MNINVRCFPGRGNTTCFHIFIYVLFGLLILSAGTVSAQDYPSQEVDQEQLDEQRAFQIEHNEKLSLIYDEAIKLAREEKYTQAHRLLDELIENDYQTVRVKMDRIVVFIWQERFLEAMEEYQAFTIDGQLPTYFTQEVARAYKKSGLNIEFDELHWEPIELYVKSIEEDIFEDKKQISTVETHIREGEFDLALDKINEMLFRVPSHYDALFLKADVYDQQGEYWWAVKIYNQILEFYPDNEAAYNLKLRSLMDLGATSLVLDAAVKNPEIVDTTVVERARTDMVMHQVRWDEPKPALESMEELKKEYKSLMEEERSTQETLENLERIKWDRILALRKDEKMKAIIEKYEEYLLKSENIPPWVKRAAADAYLYEQMPEEALAIYEELLKEDQSFDLVMSKYYTLVELGEYKQAQKALDDLDQVTPAKIIDRGILQDNWHKADIAFNKAWLLMYQDRLKEAEAYVRETKKVAPFNTNLRTAEAHTHTYRGWRRQAMKDFKTIRTMDNQLISAHIGYTRSLNENMKKQKARGELRSILAKKPANKHALRLQRVFEVEQMTVVTLSGSYTTESDGEDEWTISLRGDQPLGFKHALFAEILRRETTQPGDNGIARKLYVGDQWQINNNWRLTGALHGDYEGGSNLGYLGQLHYEPDDYWSFDLGYESNILDIPVRSRADGVEADEYSLSTTFRASELFDTTLGVSFRDFTDDNEYFNYFWRSSTAVTTRAYWKTRLLTELSYETFERQDVAYFSPEEVTSFYLIPMVEHTWFRRYDRAWVDRLYLGLGQKWQKGFGAADVGYIRYEQDHLFSDTKSWLIGAVYGLNSYDGDDVRDLTIYTTLRFRF